MSGDDGLILPPFRSVSCQDGRLSLPITARPVEIQALESFTVQITTPPASCRRCQTPLVGAVGTTVMPKSKAEIDRLADNKLALILYFFCSPCADAVIEQVRVGASCYHDTPTGQACEGCNTPLRESGP